MSATPSQLANNARCIECYIPAGMQLAVVIYLLQQLTSGGAVGNGQIRTYTADPNTEGVLPLDQTKPAIAYSLDGSGAIYGWNTTSLLWN